MFFQVSLSSVKNIIPAGISSSSCFIALLANIVLVIIINNREKPLAPANIQFCCVTE